MLKPLAFRIRPQTLSDIIGQSHLIGENGFLTNSVKQKLPFSLILFGNPGTGKTTIAEAYANDLRIPYIKINAVSSNKKELEDCINKAKMNPPLLLIIDEVHRLNKDKQDILLPVVEDGTICLVGATTANPYFAINKAIRSRCHLLEVKKLSEDDIIIGLKRAISSKNGLNNELEITDEALKFIASSSNGDFRYALNFIEVLNTTFKGQKVTLEMTKTINRIPNFQLDANEDDHYNAVSALQKSIRGSDVDAALYYLGRLIITNDLESIARRLLVTAYEDIGLANPNAVLRCKIAIDSARELGFPEARIPLADAVIDLCLSPKSKSGVTSIDNALSLIEEKPLDVLDYLKYTPVNLQEIDKYPYDRPDLWVKIQYLPELIKDAQIYSPSYNSQYEKTLNENYSRLKQIKRSSNLRALKSKK